MWILLLQLGVTILLVVVVCGGNLMLVLRLFCIQILSKLLANCLNVILPFLIFHHQNAFVLDRQIQDNIILTHESFHYLKLKRDGDNHELGLKLNMNKADDKVE